MSLLEPAYSLLAVLTALVIGILIGRITAVRFNPYRANERRKRELSGRFDAANNAARLLPETRERIERLVAEGQLIEAVRICREELDASLREARDVVNHMRTAEPRPPASRASKTTP